MMEREDGTLLRAKATPNGVLGCLTGKVVSQAAMIIAASLIVMISAGFLFEGLRLNNIAAWLTLVWVMTLGMVATPPFGGIVGSLFKNPLSLRYISLPTMGPVAISGVFYPLGTLPQWLQWIGQIFPLYWISLGMRSAMLPDALVDSEVL